MKAFHSKFGEVKVLKNENNKVTFIISETGEEKTMTSSFVNLYESEELMEEAIELKEYLKDMEELEEINQAKAELKALEIEVDAIIAKTGGKTFEEMTIENLKKSL